MVAFFACPSGSSVPVTQLIQKFAQYNSVQLPVSLAALYQWLPLPLCPYSPNAASATVTVTAATSVQYSQVKKRVQCSKVQCSTVQCSAVHCSTVQCRTVQCSTVQCSAAPYSAAQCSAAPYSTVQCSLDSADCF